MNGLAVLGSKNLILFVTAYDAGLSNPAKVLDASNIM
jgi:hypothetical protein